jgi:hypothetical protein
MPTLREALQLDSRVVAERPRFSILVERQRLIGRWLSRYRVSLRVDGILRPQATRSFGQLDRVEHYITGGTLAVVAELHDLEWWPVDETGHDER